MILLASIFIILGVGALMWYGFGPWDEPWHLDDDDYYDSPLWKTRRH